MPWTSPTGNTYKLCLLDTNAISEIVKHPSREGRGFIIKYPPSSYAPCLTIYNLIELRRNQNVFNQYVNFFSIYPHFLLKPFLFILEEEVEARGNLSPSAVIMNAFSPLGPNPSYQLRRFVKLIFGDPTIRQIEQNWRQQEDDILREWIKNKNNFIPSGKTANARDADRYVKDAAIETLIRLFPQWVKQELDANRVPDINQFPSLQVMLYSQYYRIFDSARRPSPQDVTDIEIMSAVPYMDVVITEKFQADVLRKIKPKIAKMTDLEIATLRDIR